MLADPNEPPLRNEHRSGDWRGNFITMVRLSLLDHRRRFIRPHLKAEHPQHHQNGKDRQF